jgi:hypothetical protein
VTTASANGVVKIKALTTSLPNSSPRPRLWTRRNANRALAASRPTDRSVWRLAWILPGPSWSSRQLSVDLLRWRATRYRVTEQRAA